MSTRIAVFDDFGTDAAGGSFFSFHGRLYELEVTADAALPNFVKVGGMGEIEIFANETRIFDTWPEVPCNYVVRVTGINNPQRVVVIYDGDCSL